MTIGAPSILRNRRFLALWTSQVVTQVGANALLFALTIRIESEAASATAIAAMLWAFLIPTVLVSIPAGILVDRRDARRVLVVANLLRAGLIALMAASIALNAPWPTLYAIVIPIAIATSFFAPAELAMIPRVVPREQLVGANGIFTLTLNASFVVGFAVVGPYLVSFAGATATGEPDVAPLVVIIAVLYAVAAFACAKLPSAPSSAPPLTTGALRATREQLGEAFSLLRAMPTLRWAMSYLVLSGILIGVLGTLGPGYAKGLGLETTAVGLAVLPLGLGIVLVTVLLGRLIELVGERRLVHLGLGGLALALVGLGSISVIHEIVAAAYDGPASSTLTLVATLAVLSGGAYAAAAIPSQAALSREVPETARGRIFGALNMLVSLASVAPTILIAPAADLIGVDRVLLLVGLVLAAATAGSIYGRRAEIWGGHPTPASPVPFMGITAPGAPAERHDRES